MTASTPDLRGVLPVFQTPFAADESIAFADLEREIEWIAHQGVHGVVFGMVSEALRLSDSERKAVIRVASETARGFGLPCVASVGAESTSAALGRIDDALDAGASALMATPPLTSGHNEVQLEGYFRALLVHSPVPLVIQDASGYVGQALSIGLQARLFEEFGSRVRFKPEAVPVAPTLEALLAATDRAAQVFEGMGGAALLETHAGGVSGSMPGAEVCWAVATMWNALEAGDLARAGAISAPLSQMIALQNDLDSFVVCEKYLLVRQSVLTEVTTRSPVSFALDEATRSTLDRLLDELRRVVSVRE